MYSPNSKYFQLPEIAIIRPARKVLPYTVIPIGGPDDLIAWRKDQILMAEARELRLKPIREARRARAVDMVANQNADTTLSQQDLAEIKHAKVRSSIVPIDSIGTKYVPIEEYVVPIPSLKAKILNKLANLWKSAFPDT